RVAPHHFALRCTSTIELSSLSLHDALPISEIVRSRITHHGSLVSRRLLPFDLASGELNRFDDMLVAGTAAKIAFQPVTYLFDGRDRKSTRLNSSHEWISYAVFCLKRKKHIK